MRRIRWRPTHGGTGGHVVVLHEEEVGRGQGERGSLPMSALDGEGAIRQWQRTGHAIEDTISITGSDVVGLTGGAMLPQAAPHGVVTDDHSLGTQHILVDRIADRYSRQLRDHLTQDLVAQIGVGVICAGIALHRPIADGPAHHVP